MYFRNRKYSIHFFDNYKIIYPIEGFKSLNSGSLNDPEKNEVQKELKKKKKEKKELIVTEALHIFLSITLKENPWKEILKSAVDLVNTKYPHLSDISVVYKAESLKTAVYKRKKLVQIIDLQKIPDKKTSIVRRPQENPNIQYVAYFTNELEFEYVNFNITKTYLRRLEVMAGIFCSLSDGFLDSTGNLTYPGLLKNSSKQLIILQIGDFFKNMLGILNVKSLSLKEKKLLQGELFSILLITKRSLKKNGEVTTIYQNNLLKQFAPNWHITINSEVEVEHEMGLELLPDQTLIKIVFDHYTGVKRFKSLHLFSNYFFSEEILKKKLFEKNKNLRPIVEHLRLLVIEIKSQSFGCRNFLYEALIMNLSHLTKILDCYNDFQERRFKRLYSKLSDLNKVLIEFKFGELFFPEDLTTNTEIFLAINCNIVNSKIYDKNVILPGYLERIYEEKKKGLSQNQLFEKLQEVKKEKGTKFNIFSTAFPSEPFCHNSEEDQNSTIFINMNRISFIPSVVYNSETEINIPLSESLTQDTRQGIFNTVLELSQNFTKLIPIIEKFPSLDQICAQNENKELSFLYNEQFQEKCLIYLNIYFEKIDALISYDLRGSKNFADYFSKKLEKELKFARSNPQSVSQDLVNWLESEPFFSGCFPKGYYYPTIKLDLKKNSFLRNITRIEEIRKLSEPNKNNQTKRGAIIALKRQFRKSFQANLGKFFFAENSDETCTAVDVDAKGLHGNLVLAFLGKLGTEVVNWDYIFSDLVNYVKKNSFRYIDGTLENLGVDRDSVKEHILAVINGRSPNTYYKFVFPKAFTKSHLITLYSKKKQKVIEISKHSFLINIIVKKFFTENCPLIQHALEFRQKINSMKIFMGSSFPISFSLSQKINYVLQCLESILTMALILDITRNLTILHSVERDGLVFFANKSQISTLSFHYFNILNKNIFENNILISCKYLVKFGEKSIFPYKVSDFKQPEDNSEKINPDFGVSVFSSQDIETSESETFNYELNTLSEDEAIEAEDEEKTQQDQEDQDDEEDEGERKMKRIISLYINNSSLL
jgi:hypothetical protein